MTILEKNQDMAGKWRVKVLSDDGICISLKFQIEPQEQEIFDAARRYLLNLTIIDKKIKSESLMKAEDRYILYCRSLGLTDKASSTDFDNLCTSLKAEEKVIESIEIAIRALALMNDITQNGGTWDTIEYNGVIT